MPGKKRQGPPIENDCSVEHKLDSSITLPACKAVPYALQKIVYCKIAELLTSEKSALLSTEPGTGKTLMALALLMRERNLSNPSSAKFAILVKSPLHLHWKMEISKHVQKQVARHSFFFATKTEEFVDALADENAVAPAVYIVTPSVACSEEFLSIKWKLVIIEEAHTFGNATQYFKRIFTNLKSEKRLLISATPQKDWFAMSQMLGLEEKVFAQQIEGTREENKQGAPKRRRADVSMQNEQIREQIRFDLLGKLTCKGASLRPLRPEFEVIVCEPLPEVVHARKGFDSFIYKSVNATAIWINLLNLECLISPQAFAAQEENLRLTCYTRIPKRKVFWTEECSICTEEFKDPRMTSCGHVFCWECWQNWSQTCEVQKRRLKFVQCPICKNRVQRTFAPSSPQPKKTAIPQNKKRRMEEKMCTGANASVKMNTSGNTSCSGKTTSCGSKSEYTAAQLFEMQNETENSMYTPKERCLRLYDKVMQQPKIREVIKRVTEFMFKHPQEQMIIFSKEYLYMQCLRRFLSAHPKNHFQETFKICGFEDDPIKDHIKNTRRLEQFHAKQIKILGLNIEKFASGHDFPEVSHLVIIDCDTPMHYLQAKNRAGCSRIRSNKPTYVSVFVNRGSIEEFMVQHHQQMDVSLPSHALLRQLEHFMFKDVPETRMFRLENYVKSIGGKIMNFRGFKDPCAEIVFPNNTKQILLLRHFS